MQIWNDQIWSLEEEGTYRSSLYTCTCIFILYTTYKLPPREVFFCQHLSREYTTKLTAGLSAGLSALGWYSNYRAW